MAMLVNGQRFPIPRYADGTVQYRKLANALLDADVDENGPWVMDSKDDVDVMSLRWIMLREAEKRRVSKDAERIEVPKLPDGTPDYDAFLDRINAVPEGQPIMLKMDESFDHRGFHKAITRQRQMAAAAQAMIEDGERLAREQEERERRSFWGRYERFVGGFSMTILIVVIVANLIRVVTGK